MVILEFCELAQLHAKHLLLLDLYIYLGEPQ